MHACIHTRARAHTHTHALTNTHTHTRGACVCRAGAFVSGAPSLLPSSVPSLHPTLSPTSFPSLVSGAAGSNECPAGAVRIETEAACRAAAAAAGKTPYQTFVTTESNYPRGCYAYRNYAYLNAHAVGAGHPAAQLLCAVVTTGVRPHKMWQG